MYLTVWVHKKFISDLNHFNKISDIALIIKQNKNKKSINHYTGHCLNMDEDRKCSKLNKETLKKV